MGQITRAGGGHYIRPVKSDGTSPDEAGHGIYPLAANSTYYYILGGESAPFQYVKFNGRTAALVITSATIQDTSDEVSEVSDISSTGGEWQNETPASGDAQVDGAGWTSSTAIVAADGSAVGCGTWHLSEMSAARTRLEVKTGAAGGNARVSYHGKS